MTEVVVEAPAAAPAAAPANPPPGAPVVAPKVMGTPLAPAAPADPSATALGSVAPEWSLQSVPEKYHVKGDDGEIDMAATLRKVDEGRSALEKRLGSGDARPKTPDEYKLPDNDTFKALQLDETLAKGFKEKAHGWGLSQSQYENVMNEWATLAPALVNAGQAETVETAVSALREVWGDKYDTHIRDAHSVVSKVAESAGMSFEDVEKAIGNNPTALRLFAALAPEMREDATPAAANGGLGGGPQTSAEYIAANWAAYSNPRDPQHAAVSQRANALAEREAKRAPQN